MDSFEIRRATPDDLEAVFAIHRESAMTVYAEVFPPERYAFPDQAMRAQWASALADPEQELLIAERDGAPAGFAGVSPGWLRNLFVRPAEWGIGAGSALHEEAVSVLRRHGDRAHLWVLERNPRARRFYESRGWREDGGRSRSEFPPHPLELRYVLELGAPGRTHP